MRFIRKMRAELMSRAFFLYAASPLCRCTVYINYDYSTFIEYNKLKDADNINNFKGGLILYNNDVIRLLYLGDKGV